MLKILDITSLKWIEQDQIESKWTKWTEYDQSGPNGLNRTEVDRMDQIRLNGPNWIEQNFSG